MGLDQHFVQKYQLALLYLVTRGFANGAQGEIPSTALHQRLAARQ